MKLKKLHRSKRDRQGAAIVEFAVCLPLVILIVFGSIEAASMLFLRQAMVQSSYEGAKVAIRPESTDAEVEAAVQSALGSRNLQGVSVTTIPSSIADAEPGDLIQISVAAPGNENSLLPFGPFRNRQIGADAFMVKE